MAASLLRRVSALLIAVVGLALPGPGGAVAAGGVEADPKSPDAAGAPAAVDRSGRPRVGTASVYAPRFAGKKMPDGTPMSLHDDNAASKTLPLGTKARVTNLKTGRSATVTIQDRGPYVKGRIVDLSPATAEKIGITAKEGTAQVEVAPLSTPPADPVRAASR